MLQKMMNTVENQDFHVQMARAQVPGPARALAPGPPAQVRHKTLFGVSRWCHII